MCSIKIVKDNATSGQNQKDRMLNIFKNKRASEIIVTRIFSNLYLYNNQKTDNKLVG